VDIQETGLPGLRILKPRRFGDDRGFFSEVWNRETLRKAGIEIDFAQDNHSLSRRAGTIRGLHYQAPPRAQDKLVRAGAGVILDVAVDVRRGSPTWGRVFAIELSAENGLQLLIPRGFLHGFVTRTDNAELLYKCSDVYVPDCDGAVHFASPELGIDWGVDPALAVVSDKDRAAQPFASFESPFSYDAGAA
jgi:dTDP-4-dehydrorhamnose 3,5-epimerase